MNTPIKYCNKILCSQSYDVCYSSDLDFFVYKTNNKQFHVRNHGLVNSYRISNVINDHRYDPFLIHDLSTDL